MEQSTRLPDAVREKLMQEESEDLGILCISAF